MKPVASPKAAIADFCSWRGMLVLAGADADTDSQHIVRAPDGTGLWFGNIDDLWRMGTAAGVGGPVDGDFLYAGQASGPFLTLGYRHARLALSHDLDEPVSVTLEADAAAIGRFGAYRTWTVQPGETLEAELPDGFSAHWVRVKPDRDCHLKAWFTLT